MAHLALLLHVPAALDGESANDGNSALAAVSIVSIVFGYVLLFLVWRFVFSRRAREKKERDPPE